MINYPDAVDEMRLHFSSNFESLPASILDHIPEIEWDGSENPDAKNTGEFWVRFSEQQSSSTQSSFGSNEFGKRYRNKGLIFIQIFCPKSVSMSKDTGRKIANYVKKLFQGHTDSGNVWFRDSEVRTLESEDVWYRFNVVAKYTHEEGGL